MFTRSRRTVAIVSAFAAAALTLSACGSSDDAAVSPVAVESSTSAGASTTTDTAASSAPSSDTAAPSSSGEAASSSAGSSSADPSSAETPGVTFNLEPDQKRITTAEVPEIAAKVPAAIRERGKLIVTGSAGTAPPLSFYATDDQTIIGSEVDIAHLIGNVLGLDVEYQAADWAQNFVRIDSGEVDAFISNVTVTEERKEKYDFATYRQDNLAFEALKGSGLKIEKPADIAGHKIAVGSGTNQEALLVAWDKENQAAGLPAADIQYYQNSTDYYLALSSGRIDLYFGPYPTAEYHAAVTGETEVVGNFSGAGDTLQGLIAVLTLKDNGLVGPISEAINHVIENGTYGEVLARWADTGEAVTKSEINPPGLPKTES
ncbi:ABC transporter substrate-binding protein [Nakamurella silvestris]|nr:ABC transporter substrate-binding protein [Nakamurella silvestris]